MLPTFQKGAPGAPAAQAPWPWRDGLSWLAEAGSLLLWPPACGACGRGLDAIPKLGLCAACADGLEPNLGRRCSRCDVPSADGGVCGDCQDQPRGFAQLRAPWLYLGALTRLVAATKYRGRDDLVGAQARLIWHDPAARALVRAGAVLVPVPLGRRRARHRGFNQSATLARQLARLSGVPVHHALQRCRETLPQSRLRVAQRSANVQQVFVCRNLHAAHVVLVDDVVTSGETVHQAALALRAAGALGVYVVALARAPKPAQDRIPYEPD